MSEEDKKRVKLIRMPDGSMRPATDADTDIGSVWSTQKKIRATEEYEAELAKSAPKPKLSKRLLKKTQKKEQEAAKNAHKPVVITPKSLDIPAKPVSQTQGLYRNQPTVTAEKPKNDTAKAEIAISVTMPKVSMPKAPKKHAKRVGKAIKRAPRWVYATAALVAIPAFIITWGVVSHDNAKNKPAVQGDTKSAVPDFQTVTPNGDITDTTSQKIQYDPAKKVASFTDKLNGYEITVSMQPIPANFKPNIGDNVKKVAEQFAANTVLEVDNGSAYLGTSAKGPQSLVGYRGDLLVFMKSETKIDNKAWTDYFNSLK